MHRLMLGNRAMGANLLGHLLADGNHRIQRRHRVLENHRHVAAAPLA
jgi:hypothetical protein